MKTEQQLIMQLLINDCVLKMIAGQEANRSVIGGMNSSLFDILRKEVKENPHKQTSGPYDKVDGLHFCGIDFYIFKNNEDPYWVLELCEN